MSNNLKHYEYLGQCFDINEVDPLNIPNSHKGCRVFKLDQQNMETSSEGIQYPANIIYTPIDYAERTSVSWELFSVYDIQEYFKDFVDLGLSIP